MKIFILFGLLAVVFGQHLFSFRLDSKLSRQGFIETDVNNDGILTIDDFLEIMRKQDINGDGFVDFTEYEQDQPQNTPKIVIKGKFKYFDKLDGEIDDRISFAIAGRLIDILDSDNGGAVTLDEYEHNFVHVLESKYKEINALAVDG